MPVPIDSDRLDQQRSVRGKTVFITGAAGGMGEATAQLFGHAGANVIVADRSASGAEAAAAGIVSAGGSARAWQLDVADGAAIDSVAKAAAAAFGGIDMVVNNAGVGGRRAIDDPTYEEHWSLLTDIMLAAHHRVIRACLPQLRASSSARIVNIASTEALGGSFNNSIYAAAKAGVVGLTRALAVELGREGITVNCICPGPILTGLTRHIPEQDRQTYAHRRTALRRYGQPMEVAHITLSLCLPGASYITGAVIPVDGGLTARVA